MKTAHFKVQLPSCSSECSLAPKVSVELVSAYQLTAVLLLTYCSHLLIVSETLPLYYILVMIHK